MRKKFIKLSASILSVLLILSVFLQLSHTEAVASSTDRYTVLVLDTSGSMWGTPISKEREAAKKFCEDILNASGTNYVALVTLDSTSTILSGFTTEFDRISGTIDTITDNGGTNFYSALYTANSLLENVDSNHIRNIVLCSDGLPEHGEYSSDGPYTSTSFSGYANAAYELASNYKLNYNIYTLGFFHSLNGSNLEFGRRFMSDLASDPSYYYDVVNPEDLLFTFGSIAEEVLTSDQDPIILIPGIMGSRLFLDSECSESQCAWPPNGGTQIQWDLDGNMKKDTLYVKPAVRQNDLSADEREYGAIDCMKSIVESLCTKYPNRDIYVFNYDWRKSNAESADKLNAFINSLDTNKVDIVAHSMGGLVTSKYFVRYGQSKVDKIITCGTPYEGAPKLIDAIENWNVVDNWQDTILGLLGLTKEVKSQFSGVAELTPTRNYVSVIPMWKDSKSWFSQNDYQLPYNDYVAILEEIFTQDRYQSAKSFQESLHDTSGYNALLSYDNSYFLIGTEQETITAVKFQYSNNDIDEQMYESDLEYTTKGDGTVPYLSASIMEQVENLDTDRWITINCNHQEVITNPNALVWIQNILSDETPIVQSDPNTGHAYTVIRIACPVDVEISNGFESLRSVDGEESFTASFGRLDLIGKNSEIKMLCVRTNSNLTLNLNGTDNGTMDYTIRYYNSDDVLLEERIFENVPITSDTVITTSANYDPQTVLNVDSNGDGNFDVTWTASANEAVTVNDYERIPMNDINVSVSSNLIEVGGTAQVNVEKNPVNSTDDFDVTYSSSDESVAVVDDNGKIMAVSRGSAVITVESTNGYIKNISITITDEQLVTLYFVDNTQENWVQNDNAVMELVDNTNNHKSYDMRKIDNVTWSVTVPANAYNITFNRYAPGKTTQWNTWSAGGRDSNNTYFADVAEHGHWGSVDDSMYENYFHVGDVIYLDLLEFTLWENDDAIMYANFSDASKIENGGSDVNIDSMGNSQIYQPRQVNGSSAGHIYTYVVTSLDEGKNTLRFWRGNQNTLWNCSVTLEYDEYKSGNNCIKVTDWDSQGSVYSR